VADTSCTRLGARPEERRTKKANLYEVIEMPSLQGSILAVVRETQKLLGSPV
jgi:hypothetical protein